MHCVLTQTEKEFAMKTQPTWAKYDFPASCPLQHTYYAASPDTGELIAIVTKVRSPKHLLKLAQSVNPKHVAQATAMAVTGAAIGCKYFVVLYDRKNDTEVVLLPPPTGGKRGFPKWNEEDVLAEAATFAVKKLGYPGCRSASEAEIKLDTWFIDPVGLDARRVQ